MNLLGTILGLSMVVIGLSACGDGGSSSSTGGSGGTTTTSSTSGGAGGTGGTTGGTGGTTGGTGGVTGGSGGATGGTGGTTTSGPTYGYCTKPCGTVTDCCPPGSVDCPSNMYPNNWECAQGACLSPQCATNADCTAVDPDQGCFLLGDFSSCLAACVNDGDCTAPLTCSGVDDNGAKYCKATGGGCTDDASCGGFGKCVDKVCVCAADADCTFQGYTKCAL